MTTTLPSRDSRWPRRALLAAVLSLSSPMSWASLAPVPSELAKAVDAAWQRAVQARQAQGETARAQAERAVAGSFAAAAPALELSQREGSWYGGSDAASDRESEVGVAWPLWWPGQRRAAIDAAQSDVEWSQANLDAARLEVAGQVRESAWNAATRQAELDLAQARVRFLQTLAQDVDKRVASGDLARSDALAARADLLAANAEEADARRELQTSHAQWTVLTGLKALPDPADVEKESHVDLDALLAQATPAPRLRQSELAAQRAQHRLELARKTRGDAPELTLGAREETAGPGAAAERSLILALRVPIGMPSRNAPQRAQAQTEADVAEAELTRTRAEYDAELENTRLAVESADAQLQAERERALLLGERARLLRAAFAAGEISLSDLLLASRNAAEADAAVARRQAEHGLAHARLLQVHGILP